MTNSSYPPLLNQLSYHGFNPPFMGDVGNEVFEGSDLRFTYFSGRYQRRWKDLDLRQITYTGGHIWIGKDLRGFDLSRSNFSDSQFMFRSCSMEGVNFSYADLRNCVFDSCIFTTTNFSHANMRGVAIGGDVGGAIFTETDLRGADLSGVDCKVATGRGKFIRQLFKEAITDRSTIFE